MQLRRIRMSGAGSFGHGDRPSGQETPGGRSGAALISAGSENLSAKSVLDAARAGDPLALESVETSCRYLGWAMAGITMVVDPEAYLIGGGVSRAGTFLTEKIQRYHDQLSPMATKKAKVLLATLGNDAGIYGAAKLVLG